MLLKRGRIVGYDTARMAFMFTMMHGARIVDCEISSAAMDDLAGSRGAWPHEREAQFKALRETIERIASDAFEQGGKQEGKTVSIFHKHLKGK